MDEEGRRLAGLSDEEWSRHVKRLERQLKRNDQKPNSRRPGRILLAVGIFVAAAVVTAIGLVSRHNDSHEAAAKPTPTPTRSKAPAGLFDDTPARTWPSASAGLALPTAKPAGPYSAALVKGALGRARTYLLTARTSPAVLVHHDLNALTSLTAAKASRSTLYQTFLAPGNTLAAPVRVSGSVTYAFTPSTGDAAEHLAVSGNLVWAYALKATYAVPPPRPILVRHEHIRLDFYLDADMDGPDAGVYPARDQSFTYNMDCGYENDHLLGLPRVDDPDALPDVGGSTAGAFNPDQPVDQPGRGCKD
jgi:hypothetical protein